MFGVSEPRATPLVDKRNIAFGDAFVLVLNTQAFINRVAEAAESAGLKLDLGVVEYFDAKTYSGEVGPFRKSAEFSHQQEFRFAISPGGVGPIRLVLGDLSDITSSVHDLADINERIDFSPTAAEAAGILLHESSTDMACESNAQGNGVSVARDRG